MGKNLYPLMLSEDVVSEIDRLAYERGTNRSNMINQILAEYVSYTTPEMRMSEIFSRVDKLLSGKDSFRPAAQNTGGSVYSLRSALAYKYNPNVKYTVELYRVPRQMCFGELRVGLRTQNSSLILYLTQYYKLFVKIEAAYHPGCEYLLDGGKLTRKLVLSQEGAGLTDEELGSQIADFISAFDRGLKAYFYSLDDPSAAIEQVEKIYRDYYRSSRALI
jgi:hypothetical protein